MTDPTPKRLKELLDYDPDAGVFTWRVARGGTAHAGSVAGNARPDGYREIKVDGKQFKAHRLAWLYVHGEWPIQIDHINGAKDDNRLDNLREAKSYAEQLQNLKLYDNNTSGYPGVHWNKGHGKYQAYIRYNGKLRHLGYFDDLEEAARVHRVAKRKYHKFCPEVRDSLSEI